MRLSRLAKLLAAIIATFALVLGAGTAANAYAPRVARPACEPAFPLFWEKPNCTAQRVYDDTLHKINAALASSDATLRYGTLRYLITDIVGGGVIGWGKDAPGRYQDLILLNDDVLSNLSKAPDNPTIACYGNVLLGYVVNKGATDANVENMYAMIDAFEKVNVAREGINVLRTFGDDEEFVKELGKFETKAGFKIVNAKLHEQYNVPEVPLSMFELYIDMAKATEAPLKYVSADEQFKRMIEPLTNCNVGIEQNAPAYHPVVRVKRYSAQQAFMPLYEYDSKHRSRCKKVAGGALQCRIYDAKRNTVAGDGGYAACLGTKNLSVPGAVAKEAQDKNGMLGVRLALTLPKLSGGGWWKGYPALWHGTFTKAGTYTLPSTKRMQWMPMYASDSASSNWWNASICFKPHTTVTIKAIAIAYRTEVLR